tara:strand:+ start:7150 stop:7944 length:795 start_codon:yes stop_codon:yes gene_type:complete
MSHVSYSEIKIWKECSWKHKLLYLDKLKGFKGNEYTAFGTAIHSTYEKVLLEEKINEKEYFQSKFLEELKELPEEVKNNLNKKLVEDLRKQGDTLASLSMNALKDYFGNFEVVSVEEQLYEPIKTFLKEEHDFNFKGFIDLVLKTDDGKYHIIDWKTCSWGWDSRKKTDKMITYQLTFYKYYFALKHDIDPKNIETYFGLVKRTAKKNNIELFRTTSGPKKTENAINFLNKVIYNINKSVYVKNKLSCHGMYGTCEFYKTEHCI